MTKRSNDIILVTGSSGFIGKAVCGMFRREAQVVGFDLAGNPMAPKEIECVCVDLTSDESVACGLDRVRHGYGRSIASVVHLAAYYDFAGEPSPLYDEVTVRGTERLLNGLQDFEVGQFLFSSTMLVHGPTEPGQPITEESPLDPRWDYPESKAKTEKVIRGQRGKIPAVSMRIAGVYTDECDSIPLSQQIHRIHQNTLTSKVYPGDPSHGQAFLHLDDLLDAIRRAVERRDSLPGETTLLIGEPETASYEELQQAFGRLLHDESSWTTEVIPKPVAKTGAWIQGQIPGMEDPFIKPWMIDLADDHYELDIGKARGLLGWKPKHRLMDTLPKMIEAFQSDPEGWYRRHDLDTADLERLSGTAARA